MKIAFCTKIDFKPEQGDTTTHNIIAGSFENLDLTVQEVAEYIDKGYPFSAHHRNRRKDSNFLRTGFIAVDIDYGWQQEDLLALPFVKNYVAIVYTTVSHTPQAHRLRVLMELEEEITDPTRLRRLVTGAIKFFGGDKACKSACQMFYGSKGCAPFVIGKILTKEQIERLIKLGEDIGNASVEDVDNIDSVLLPHGEKNRRQSINKSPTRSSVSLLKNQGVQLANRSYGMLKKMTARTSVFCPMHGDRNASAFVVTNESGINGVHCRTCNMSFWPEENSRSMLLDYDFSAYERHVDKLEFDEDPMHLGDDAPREFWDNELRQIQRRNQKYLSDIPLRIGITGLVSPTGSGKTALLKKTVKECRASNKTVLVIGHRQLLLAELARNLDLHFYRDKVDYTKTDKESAFGYLAICIDSMPNLLNTAREKYDVVIIDESEQVFRHLVAKTLGANRRQCYFQIEFFLKHAKSIILSDADMGFLTINTVERMVGKNRNTKIYVNAYKPKGSVIDLYDSKNHLIVEMKTAVLEGGRHYICCNSKTTALLMKKILIEGGKAEKKIMLISADNSQTTEVMTFLKNITTAILEFDVLISSPSLGTGIDITFNDSAQLIDTTFGFFDAGITTHFDLDQQLARVRHPKAVKAWISPQIFYAETNPVVIKDFCVTSGEITDTLTGYDSTGHPMYGTNDKILTLYSDVMSMSNASKNNLKKHFIDLKSKNGWEINYVEKGESGLKEISKAISEAKASLEEEEFSALASAKDLDDFEFSMLREKNDIRNDEILSFKKFNIKKFYREDVTPELLKLDNRGKFRRQLHMMALFMSNPFSLAERDAKRNDRLSIDRENHSLKSELLKELLPLSRVTDIHGNFDLDIEITSADLGEFASICLGKSYEIRTLLAVNVRRNVRQKPMNQLTDILKLIGMGMLRSRHSDDKSGKRTFYYKVNVELHNLVMRYLPLVDKEVDFEVEFKKIAQKEKERKASKQQKNIHR